MAATRPERSITEGIRTLEVRWILPGEPGTAVAVWFGRFTAGTESRADTYLLNPHLPGLSVKIRAGGALEVKMYRSSPGVLDVADRARGRMESWQKWSFPFGLPGQGSGEAVGWRPVHKRRRIGCFSLAGAWTGAARVSGLSEEPGCMVELTGIRAHGEAWWSLGFEATGPADLLHGALEGAAALVFAESLPNGVELGMDNSRSYAEWLWRQPDGESGRRGRDARGRAAGRAQGALAGAFSARDSSALGGVQSSTVIAERPRGMALARSPHRDDAPGRAARKATRVSSSRVPAVTGGDHDRRNTRP